MKWLLILALILNFSGGIFLIANSFMPQEKAIELGVARWAGDTKEQNLQLPMVQNLITQSHFAKIGTILLTAGFALQLVVIIKEKS